MKKICLVLFSILIFVIGFNFVNAETYYFDLKADRKDIDNILEYEIIGCIGEYFREDGISQGYTYNGPFANDSHTYYYKNDKLLFNYIYTEQTGHPIYTMSNNLTEEDNFEFDITGYDLDICSFTVYGYDKIKVLFDGDELGTVVDEFTTDFTSLTDEELSADSIHNLVYTLLFFLDDDQYTPNYTSSDDFYSDLLSGNPITLYKGDMPILNVSLDLNEYVYVVERLNADKLTTDDNIVITGDDLADIATKIPDGAATINMMRNTFNKINVIFSNTSPENEDDEEETLPVIPDKKEEKKDKKNKDENPKTGDNILTYISILGTSLTGLVLIKRKQNN